MTRGFRLNLILVLFALGTTLAAVAGWRFARASAPVSGPIVLVTIDALRADRMPVYGYRGVKTPAFEALAADGVVFERALSHAPLTLPAHTSLLSGQLPPTTGVRDNVGTVVPPSVRFISSLLADRGYNTGGVVSSYMLRRETGMDQGFAFFEDELRPASESSDDPVPPVVSRDGAEAEVRAERWLSAAGTARAFLFLHLSEPHAPYTPPERFVGLDPYDGEVAYADEILGRLVSYLKKQQLYEESVIIVVGDHGESLGAHGESQHGLHLFDETLRVPFIVKLPGSEHRGARISDVVQHVDIVPTILDLAKAPIPDGLDGRSLRPLLEGRSQPGRLAYAETMFPASQYGWSPIQTVSDGRFRYVTGPVPALYDSEADPDNRDNVASTHPEEVARLVHGLRAIAEELEVPPPFRLLELPQDEQSRLLATGAVGPRSLVGDVVLPGRDWNDAAGSFVDTYAAAMSAVAHAEWPVALERLRSLARTDGDHIDIVASLAVVAESAGRADLAIEAYRRVVASAPHAADIRVKLASLLLRNRRLDEARQQAEFASEAEEEPLRVDAHHLLARIALARRDIDTARLEAERIRAIDGASPLPDFIEGRVLTERAEYDEAIARFDAAVALSDNRPVADLQLARGEALAKAGRLFEAESAMLDEIRAFPASIRAYLALATLYYGDQRPDEAAAVIERMTKSRRSAEAFDSAVRFWTAVGDRARADAARENAHRRLAAGTASVTH